MSETIFALSSGSPPAAIAVVRISGPLSGDALVRFAGRLPAARRATFAPLRDSNGELLDRALVLWLPGPGTSTGEDMVELHLHGGRAVIGAVEDSLADLPGLRRAEAGEFTRRGFANGRLDLAEAEGLADLLAAETELQRRTALAMASGVLSAQAESWRERILGLSATVEGVLDFSDEDDTADLPASFSESCSVLASEIGGWLARPRVEVLREGFTVVLAGPPNSGKSTLFNALTESEAAITSPHPGTTRDLISRTVAMEGVPFRFVDTAGLREQTAIDPVERIGIDRARAALMDADLILWLGPEGAGEPIAPLWEVAARQDCADARSKPDPSFAVSARTGEGLGELRSALLKLARNSLPKPGEAALNARQHRLLTETAEQAAAAGNEGNPLLIAEHLRAARSALDSLVGRAGTEDMLDALFSRFCIGK